MPVHIEPHAEPIPGYRLIERLGSGGFGEVWKAEAPGGLFKAIKFVQRDVGSQDAIDNDTDHSRADQEWKSLLRVKTVRHPFILLLDRFEIIDNFLVIVMELADRTLADRFKECRSQGLPGLPRDELLGYMAEAAEVLDLMNSQYQLQHLDIKPQNLFLVHNHIKVADFGLVKDTTAGGKLMTITGGVTPVYAAPETFDGKFSRQSDQYSLAIVYQEMLTGRRPFTGTSMKQLILQHMQNAHDLTPMPVHDRPIIAKALAKIPEDRFATCEDLVRALRKSNASRSGVLALPASTDTPLPGDKAFPSLSRTVGARGHAGAIKTAEPNFSVSKAFLGVKGSAPARAESPATPHSDEAVRSTHTAVVGQRKSRTPRTASHELSGLIQPALVIGLGQLGVGTLTQLRQRISTDVCPAEALPYVRFIALDSDAETLHQATTMADERAVLRTSETLLTRLQRPSHYLKTRDGKLPTDSWLNPKLLYRIPRGQTRASLRALGRLAFVDSYRVIAKRLETELRACCSQDTPHDSVPLCDLGLRTTKPRVYIVTSLAGNSGSGMFVDVAYLMRKLLNEQGHADAEIVGLFYVPAVRRDGSAIGALGNTYASLVELKHYTEPNAIFSSQYETAASASKGERVAHTGPAFQRCVFLPLPEPRCKVSASENEPMLARVGDYLYRDLMTPVGPALDALRHAKVQAAAAQEHGPVLEAIGQYRLRWPRHALLERGARRLCSQLVTRWMNKDAKPFVDTLQQWTQERWESLGMRPESLIERFQQLAEHALQQKPEQLLADLLSPLHQALGQAKEPGQVNMAPVVQTLDGLERILGIPEELRTSKHGPMDPALLERTFAEIAHVISDECEQRLAEMAVTLLEDPNFRLAGAEEALRQFCKTVEQALQAQEILAKELAEQSAQLFVRIQQLIDKPLNATTQATSTKWLSLGRRPAAEANQRGPDLFELVRTYCKSRFHSLVLANLNGLYVGLRGHLSDQIREVGFCRQRLGELLGLVDPAGGPVEKKDSPLAGIRTLLPPGCLEIGDALEQIVQSITVDDLLSFDDRVQSWIRNNCRALLEVCMGSATVVRNLAPAMLQEAQGFLGERLQGMSVAEMYLSRKRGELDGEADTLIADDLLRCLDEATPELGRISDSNEITLMTLPDDEPGQELRELLEKRCPGAKILMTERQDEMLFCHEIVNVQWSDLPQMGPVAQECYQQRCEAEGGSPHSREDVFEWEFIVEKK